MSRSRSKQDKHAQDKHEQELSPSGRQWRPSSSAPSPSSPAPGCWGRRSEEGTSARRRGAPGDARSETATGRDAIYKRSLQTRSHAVGGLSGGGWDGDAPPLPAGSRCATLLDRTDRMARQGVTASASDGNEGGHVGLGTDTHTHSHTHAWGIGEVAGRRSGMGSGFVFARRSTRCVRGLPRGSLSIYLSIYRDRGFVVSSLVGRDQASPSDPLEWLSSAS